MAVPFDQDMIRDLEQAIETNDAALGLTLLERVRELIQSTPQADIDAHKAYEEIEATAMTIAMKFLAKATLIQLFERDLYSALVLPEAVDLIDNLKARLIDETFVDDRNAFRQRLREAIERSESQIARSNIKLGDQLVKPLVANWIKLYTAEVGAAPTTVKQARFFAQNTDVKNLSEVELHALKRLIRLYEYLKLRSNSIEGFEGEIVIDELDGRPPVIIGGGTVRSEANANTIKTFKEMAREGALDPEILIGLIQRYPEEFKEFVAQTNQNKAIPTDAPQRAADFFARQSQKYAKLSGVSGIPLPDRTAALVAMLHKAMSRGQEADLILAREILQNVVSDQDRFLNFMRHTSVINLLQEAFPSALGEKNQEVVKQSPASPLALRVLLEIVFTKFNVPSEEVVWHAFEVLRKAPMDLRDIKTIVTYDVSQDKLVWRY